MTSSEVTLNIMRGLPTKKEGQRVVRRDMKSAMMLLAADSENLEKELLIGAGPTIARVGFF